MLNRQRALLEFLKVAAKPVTRLELTKWSFLLRMETESEGGSAFYDFLAYRYGPFSFALFQELDKLASTNFVEAIGDREVSLGNEARVERGVDQKTQADIARIHKQFGRISHTKLIDYVYENYPAYTFNSEIRRLTSRPTVKPKVYTAGYEGRSIDSFLSLLMENGIRRLVDVRMNPIARRYGFHKSTLDRLCGRLDIEYVHVPKLGIRSEKRQELDGLESYERLFADYEQTTLTEESEAIDDVVRLAAEKPSVLVCMEADHYYCHRSRLANEVSLRSGLPIEHLGSPSCG